MPQRERTTTRPYRSPTREDRAVATRRRILAAAHEHFVSAGYAGTTMRLIASAAGVSVPTVELAFGTKAAVLKAAIDVAIAGDDEPVPVLGRPWADDAAAARSGQTLLDVVVGVLAAAQERSAGLVLAALEASTRDDDLAALAAGLVTRREATATWVVDRLDALGALRPGLPRADAVETLWLLMDPAVFTRLTVSRGWSRPRYERWMVDALVRLLLPPVDTEESP